MRKTTFIVSIIAIMAIQSHAQTQRVKVGVGYAATATATAKEFVFEQAPNSDNISNGSFGSDTNWTKTGGWSITGGAATFTNSAAATGVLSQASIDIDTGRKYRLTYTVAGIIAADGTTITPTLGNVSGTSVTTNGTYEEDIFLMGSETLSFRLVSTNACTNTIDNVYLRETPKAAYVDVLNLLSTATNTSVYFSFNCDSTQFADIYAAGRCHILAPSQELALDFADQKEPIYKMWYRTSTGSQTFNINAR